MNAQPKKPRQQVVRGRGESRPSPEQHLPRLRDEGLLWTTDNRWHPLARVMDNVVVATWRRFTCWGAGDGPSHDAPREMAAILYAEIQRRGLAIAPRIAWRAGLSQPCSVASCGRPAHVVVAYRQYCDQHKGLADRLTRLYAAAKSATSDAKGRRYAPPDA